MFERASRKHFAPNAPIFSLRTFAFFCPAEQRFAIGLAHAQLFNIIQPPQRKKFQSKMRLQPHARSMAISDSFLFRIVEFPYRLKSFESKHFMFHQIEQRNRILGCEWISLCSYSNILHCGGVYASNGVGDAGEFDQNIQSKWGWAPAFVSLNANRHCKRFRVFFFLHRIWHMWRSLQKLFRRE